MTAREMSISFMPPPTAFFKKERSWCERPPGLSAGAVACAEADPGGGWVGGCAFRNEQREAEIMATETPREIMHFGGFIYPHCRLPGPMVPIPPNLLQLTAVINWRP
jgi:hypothetical protein